MNQLIDGSVGQKAMILSNGIDHHITVNGHMNAPQNSEEANKPPMDERSQKGHFGWTTLAGNHIPYIFRDEERYCSVRILELKVLNQYLRVLHPDIYSCTCIRSYYLTAIEAHLFNQINFLHCDSQFGHDQFTTTDLVVK